MVDIAGNMLRSIPLTCLRHAVVVAELLNFRHAANVLGTSQSTVSARIKDLEDVLGIALFERRHRGVLLTEAGRRFIAEVSTAIGQLDHAVLTAAAVSSGMTGRLAIGLISSTAGGFIAELRTRFRAKYPEVEQVIMEGPSAQTVGSLRDGKLDVALVLDPVEAPDCHSRQLWAERYLIALPLAHRLAGLGAMTWADLRADTLLLRISGAGPQLFEHIVRRMAEQGRPALVRRCDVGCDTLMHMVAGGEGVTLASETARYMNCPGIVFRPIADETEQARFSAIWSPHNKNPALRNLLDLAFEMSKSIRPV